MCSFAWRGPALPETHVQAVKGVWEGIAHAPLLTQDEYARHAKQVLVQQA